MSYNKVYENKPIWHNDREPSINEARLNALSNATDIIDNRVIELGDRGVENLPDVSITDLQDGQGIKWNEELQKWENGVVGGIVDITTAEYEYLVEHDLDDRTVTYNLTDLNPDGTLIDDSLTESATKTWSINNLRGKFSAINSNLSTIYPISTIATSTDANTLITNGVYMYDREVGENINLPSEYSGRLCTVMVVGFARYNHCTQIAYTNNRTYFYIRSLNSGIWTSWVRG